MHHRHPSSASGFFRTATITCAITLLLGVALITPCRAAQPSPSSSPNPTKKNPDVTANPLLTESTLPYNLPPFDKIKDEHFQPALEQGIAEEEKEAEGIAKQTEKPTFDNTIVALEKSALLLARA